jgi:predicted NBD/HSP70 family sugar kinase
VADLRGEMLAHDVVPTPLRLPPERLLARLAEALRKLMRDAHLPSERLVAVGAGAPGAVAWDTGVVTFAPNLGGWTHVPMRGVLERELGVPAIVENDVNLAILGERWRGAARGHHTCAYITVGTGIGAGIIVDGVLHRGHHFIAGEIAFMCMGPQFVDTRPHRCLESLASLKALAETYSAERDPAQRDPADFVDEALRAGTSDPHLSQAVQEAAVLIGIAVANLSVVVDPSLVVLAGALMAEGLPVVAEVLRVVGQVVPAPPQIVLSALGKEAPLWGCLLMASDEARSRLRHQLRPAAVS